MTEILRTNEQAWSAHTAAEFVTLDVDATMSTMTENPTVLHVATSVGARGREAVRQFYTDHFIGHQASDMQLLVTSHTATETSVVEEMTISFTHDAEIPWILPAVEPSGRRVVVPIVAVIGTRNGLVHTEHIYWDQATVLAQMGLVDTSQLPIIGAEQADLLSPSPAPEKFNRLLIGRST